MYQYKQALLGSAIGLAVGAAAPQAALAQVSTASGGPPASVADNATSTFGEIVVTAQRRPEELQKTPVAVQAFGAEAVKQLQLTDVSSLPQHVAGFVVTNFRAIPAFVIRGVNIISNSPAVEQNTALYVDGVYMPFAQTSLFAFSNISKVEVDKGPQGTLFGRNAIGGVVSVDTDDPGGPGKADIHLGYGNYNTSQFDLYATKAINDQVAGDVSLYWQDQGEGWGKNLFNNSAAHTGGEKSARSKWTYKPDDKTRFTFIADYDKTTPNTAEPALPTGLFPGLTYGQPHAGGFYDTYEPIANKNVYTQWGANLKAERDLGWAHGTSVTAYRAGDMTYTSYSPAVPPYQTFGAAIFPTSGYTVANGIWGQKTTTQEFDLSSEASSKLAWTAGFFGYWDNAFEWPGRGGLVYERQLTDSYALFGQATYPVTADTRVTGGYRYTIDHRSVEGMLYTSLVGTPIVAATPANNPVPEKTWYNSSFKVALDHDFTDTLFGYASYSTGFQSGFYNIPVGPAVPPTNPEKIDAVDIGLKFKAMGGRVRLNTSAFYYKLHNQVMTSVINQVGQLTNAAASEYKGADVELTLQATDNLSFTASASYVDPKYTTFQNAQFYRPGTNGLSWTAFTGDASGLQVQNTEKTQVMGAVVYYIPIKTGTLSVSADAAYHSGTVFDAQNIAKQPNYTLVNGNLIWTSADKAWDVQIWGKNLGNEKYASNITPSNVQFTFQPAAPRTFGIRIGRHFGG